MNKKRESENLDNDIVMYILVNNDLNMLKGKIASQACHSACSVVSYLTKYPTYEYKEWNRNGSTKIVLRCNQDKMEYLIGAYKNRNEELWCDCTHDMGKTTQIPEGSLTTLAFCPIRRDKTPDILKRLKLL